jgi:PAS domain S-box-containing protein
MTDKEGMDEAGISQRQRQIVEFAARGMTDKDIARQLGLSEGTLRTYWDRLRKRLDAQSRTEVLARLSQHRYDRLFAAHEELLHLLRHLPQFVWTAQPSGHVDFCNDWFGHYGGLAPGDCLGAGCRALMREDELPDSAARWRTAQETEAPYEANVRFRCALDGSWRWHRIRLVPLRNEKGEVYRWIGTAHELFPQEGPDPLRLGTVTVL